MNIDLSSILEAALSRSWARSQGKDALSWVVETLEGTDPDWDEGAGENWARVLTGANVVGFVWMRGPLVILTSSASAASVAIQKKGICVVTVPRMDSNCFTADRSVVERLAERPISDVFNSGGFSPEDLVWATI